MSNKNRLLISVVFLFIVIGFFWWYISDNWSQFEKIELSSPFYLLPAFIFSVLNIYSIGAVMELAIEPHGVKLSNKEILGLSSLTRFSNQFSPSYISAAIRAGYLKKTYDVSYSKFSSSFILSNLLQFFLSGVLVLITYLPRFGTSDESQPLVLVLGAIILFAIIIYSPVNKLSGFFSRLHNKYNKRIFLNLNSAVQEFDKVRRHPNIFYKAIFWMLITILSSSAILYSLYFVIGYTIGLLPVVFIAALSSWTIVFSITPASIGVREGLMIVGARLMGVPIPLTIAVAVLLRVVTLASSGILSGFFAPRLLNKTLLRIKDIAEDKS